MTLRQLRYMVQVAQTGSIHTAAQALYITQPSLSKAIADLESEIGVTLFERGSRGVTLTEEGFTFLAYARQVLEQYELMEKQYKPGAPIRRVFAVSAQHYAFAVNAFVALVREYGQAQYEFSLRESRTYDIIEDVRTHRSQLGIVYLSHFNRKAMQLLFRRNGLTFTPLFTARPHVFVSRFHPLAQKACLTLAELSPYPRLTYEQGLHNSFFLSEELHSEEYSPRNIIVSDRATLFNLLIGLNGYTISSGILTSDLNGDNIISVPLQSDEEMEIGCLLRENEAPGAVAERYLALLKECVAACQAIVLTNRQPS